MPNPVSAETREKIAASRRGKKWSEEIKQRISASKKGKRCSVATEFKQNERRSPATEFGAPGWKPWNQGQRQGNIKQFKCRGCGKEFSKYCPSSRNVSNFCSSECAYANRSGAKHPNWRGGRFKIRAGYVKISIGDGLSQYEHSAMAEKALGRPFRKGECVHHLDGRKDQNRNTNFLICSQQYHKLIERIMLLIYQLEHFGGMDHAEAVITAKQMITRDSFGRPSRPGKQ